MQSLERFENSFIENPSLALVDFEDKIKENQRLYLRIQIMDKFFVNSFYYHEAVLIDERVKNKVFRLNMFNVFCVMFKESTIKHFFDFSKEATLSGLFKAMIFLLNNSSQKKYYPIKCTILEFIIHEILFHKFTKDLKGGWLEIKAAVKGCFDENDFNEYFIGKDKIFGEGKATVVVH